MTKKIIIVSGTFEQAWQWADEHKLEKKFWSYATSPESLRGLRGVKVVYCGEWRQRPDSKELMTEAYIASRV